MSRNNRSYRLKDTCQPRFPEREFYRKKSDWETKLMRIHPKLGDQKCVSRRNLIHYVIVI